MSPYLKKFIADDDLWTLMLSKLKSRKIPSSFQAGQPCIPQNMDYKGPIFWNPNEQKECIKSVRQLVYGEKDGRSDKNIMGPVCKELTIIRMAAKKSGGSDDDGGGGDYKR